MEADLANLFREAREEKSEAVVLELFRRNENFVFFTIILFELLKATISLLYGAVHPGSFREFETNILPDCGAFTTGTCHSLTIRCENQVSGFRRDRCDQDQEM